MATYFTIFCIFGLLRLSQTGEFDTQECSYSVISPVKFHFAGRKTRRNTTILTKSFLFWGLLYPPTLCLAGSNLACESKPVTHASVPNFSSIGILYYHPCKANKKLSYSRGTARHATLLNSCYVSRGMGAS